MQPSAVTCRASCAVAVAERHLPSRSQQHRWKFNVVGVVRVVEIRLIEVQGNPGTPPRTLSRRLPAPAGAYASAQIADLVDDALERCGPNCDAVFQREDDHSLHRNMGFIVLRVCESVRHLFEAVGLATAAAKGMRGGVFRGPNVPQVRGITPATDQQIVNVALWEPERLLPYDDELVKSSRPCLKTALMPSQEVATRGYLLQVSLRYKNKFGMSLYHVNDYGGIPHPDKARSAKMSELLLVERGVFKQKQSALRELDKFRGRRERMVAEADYEQRRKVH